MSDETLVRFLPDRSESAAPVALAVFWPEPQYRAVMARWPGLAALLGSTWEECRARTQRYCLQVDGHGLQAVLVAGDAAGLGEHLAAAGVAQPSERDLAAYPDLRTVAPGSDDGVAAGAQCPLLVRFRGQVQALLPAPGLTAGDVPL